MSLSIICVHCGHNPGGIIPHTPGCPGDLYNLGNITGGLSPQLNSGFICTHCGWHISEFQPHARKCPMHPMNVPGALDHIGDTSGSFSKADTTNPKDLLGAKKVSITKLPFIAVLHGAMAMMNGADRYGPYNWRDKKVQAAIYIDAAERHINSWFEGEQIADDSGVHHLGHAIACLAILLDAEETGNLVDDRPFRDKEVFGKVLKRLNDTVKSNSEKSGK